MAKQATAVVELLMGLGGQFTSAGCIQMSNYLNSLPWCICNLRAWDDWRTSASVLSKVAPGVRRIQAGYSNGGSMVSKVAGYGFPIDLCFGFDPTIWLPPKEFGVNVGVVYNLWNTNPLSSFPPVGHARYSRAPGASSTLPLTNQKVYEAHTYVDKDPANQKTFYKQIELVVNRAPWTRVASAYNAEWTDTPAKVPTGSLANEFRPESGG